LILIVNEKRNKTTYSRDVFTTTGNRKQSLILNISATSGSLVNRFSYLFFK
jgi:hypothetical protein